MAYFIAGVLTGVVFAALSLTLVAAKDADLKDRRIRELTSAARVRYEQYHDLCSDLAWARQQALDWQQQYWTLRAQQTETAPTEAAE